MTWAPDVFCADALTCCANMVSTHCSWAIASSGHIGSTNGCTLVNTRVRKSNKVTILIKTMSLEDQKRFGIDDAMGRIMGYMKAFADYR